ncbi:hypothetical protein B0H10DRAFT_1953076 [Mycena sp. CBHHK59/15]|nr:hypothetical protein B0H10DRAFT_1953076 [Mycena sp. CBHHK59/15]
MAHVPQLLDRLGDHRLHVLHITELFHLVEYQQIEDAEGLRRRAEEHFKLIEDPNLEGNYYRDHDGNACDIPRVLECYTRALSLSTDTSAGEQHCRALDAIAQVQWQIGNYRTSQKQAQKAQHYAAALGNLFREANSIYTETASCIAIGDFSRCLDLIAKARILLSVCGLQGGELENGLDNVAAEIHLLKTEYAESRSLNQDIANKTSKTKSPLAYGYAMANLAYIDITIGAEEDKIRDSMDAARSTFSAMAFSDGVLVVDATSATGQVRIPKMFRRISGERC